MVRAEISNDWKLSLKSQISNLKSRWLLRLIASAAVSAFIVAILLKELPTAQGEQTANVLSVLRQVAVPWLVLYFLCNIGQTVLRAIRYAVLLRAAGEKEVPGFVHMLIVTMTRNMFIDLLPARAGELVYLGLLNRGYKMSGQSCLSSLAVSMVFDLLALGMIFLFLLVAHLMQAAFDPLLAAVAALFLIMPFGVLYALYAAPRPILRWARKIAGEKPARWIEKIISFGDRVADAMETTRRSGTTGRTLALSLGVRLFKYIGLFGAFRAVTVNSFPELAHASLLQVLTALISSEAAASLPVPSLMRFGTYEAGGTAAWKMLGFAAAPAAIATLAFHICGQVLDYVVGGLGLLLFTLFGGKRALADGDAGVLSYGDSRDATAAAKKGFSPAIKIVSACVIAVACAALAAWQFHKFQKIGSISPPTIGRAVKNSPDVAAALKPVLGGRKGFVVWSSNRAGNHDIWRMDLQTGKLRQLTRDPHVDYFPRISPDGKRIVFARSRELWVPQRNETPWNAWILDLDSGRETNIAEFANAPTWLDDNTICFQRRGTQVVSRVISSGEEKVLFEAAHGEIPPGALLETPSYNPATHELATTIRGVARLTALIDEKNHARPVDDGCQLHWTPDGQALLDVNHGGKIHNAIYLIDPQTMKRTQLFDSPTDWSHEYFPKLSPDGKFLAYGASTGGHEHDSADYEIFLWKVGSPMESAVRLTYHTGNDCWPDVWLEK